MWVVAESAEESKEKVKSFLPVPTSAHQAPPLQAHAAELRGP